MTTATAPTETPTVTARVQAGAAWLDSEKPDWLDTIVASRIDMTDTHDCILGQIYGNYWDCPKTHRAVDSLASERVVNNVDRWAVAHGFQGAQLVPGSYLRHIDYDYTALGLAWKREIRTRRAARWQVTP